MSFEPMEAAAANAVESLKKELDEKHTILVMIANESGGWAARWSIANPLAAIGLAKLGLNALESPAVKKDEPKPTAP